MDARAFLVRMGLLSSVFAVGGAPAVAALPPAAAADSISLLDPSAAATVDPAKVAEKVRRAYEHCTRLVMDVRVTEEVVKGGKTKPLPAAGLIASVIMEPGRLRSDAFDSEGNLLISVSSVNGKTREYQPRFDGELPEFADAIPDYSLIVTDLGIDGGVRATRCKSLSEGKAECAETHYDRNGLPFNELQILNDSMDEICGASRRSPVFAEYDYGLKDGTKVVTLNTGVRSFCNFGTLLNSWVGTDTQRLDDFCSRILGASYEGTRTVNGAECFVFKYVHVVGDFTDEKTGKVFKGFTDHYFYAVDTDNFLLRQFVTVADADDTVRQSVRTRDYFIVELRMNWKDSFDVLPPSQDWPYHLRFDPALGAAEASSLPFTMIVNPLPAPSFKEQGSLARVQATVGGGTTALPAPERD